MCSSDLGALRDVSTIFWLSMAWYGVPTARQLIGEGVVDEAEFNGFVRSRDFLWRVRTGLHLLAGRENDRRRHDKESSRARAASAASPAAERITGQVMVVYGGMVAVVAAPVVEERFDASGDLWTADDLDKQLGGFFAGRDPHVGFAADSIMKLTV